MAFYYPDYFPFCAVTIGVTAGTVGDNTPYPVGMPLEAAMALYWKPKTIRITESWHTEFGGEFGYTNVVIGSTNVVLNTGKTKMSDAVCPPFDVIINGGAGPFNFSRSSGTPPNGQYNDRLTLQLFVDYPYLVFYNDLYYPRIVFYRQGELPAYWEWSSINGGGPIQPFYRATIRVNGIDYSFQMYGTTAGDDPLRRDCKSIITIDEERDFE
jgi:hypothetical protein